jgi:hypothetical protein
MLTEQGGSVSDKGRAAGEALVEGHRGRVDIAGRAGRSARNLLGRRVSQRPRWKPLVTGACRDAEVSQFADAVTVDEHVLRLVVPMHDTALVRRRQAE